MSRLTPLHWKKLRAAFLRAGFREERTTGSHLVLSKDGVLRPLVIPMYDEVGLDIIQGLIRSSGLKRKQFIRLLK